MKWKRTKVASPSEGFTVEWMTKGEKPQCAPNPAFPNGIDVDLTKGKPGCVAKLPYPAPCIGTWIVTCEICGFSGGLTAAGRIDDPRTVKLPCKGNRGVGL